MKNKFLSILFVMALGVITKTYAQVDYILLQDAKGNIITDSKYQNVEGSPYIYSNWVTGNLMLANNKTYKNVTFKYDQADDNIYIKGEKDETLALSEKVKEFSLAPANDNPERKFKSGFNISGSSSNSFFEVLADGKTQFLKKTSKVIQENKDYNSASGTKVFYETTKYYLYNAGKATQIKKDRKSIITALADKQSELEAYIKSNNLNLKEETDIAKLIVYYNTI